MTSNFSPENSGKKYNLVNAPCLFAPGGSYPQSVSFFSTRMLKQLSAITANVNAINNVSACSVLFLSMTGLFPARRKILEHDTQSSALMFF